MAFSTCGQSSGLRARGKTYLDKPVRGVLVYKLRGRELVDLVVDVCLAERHDEEENGLLCHLLVLWVDGRRGQVDARRDGLDAGEEVM